MPHASASVPLSGFRLRISGSSEGSTTHSRSRTRTNVPTEKRWASMDDITRSADGEFRETRKAMHRYVLPVRQSKLIEHQLGQRKRGDYITMVNRKSEIFI